MTLKEELTKLADEYMNEPIDLSDDFSRIEARMRESIARRVFDIYIKGPEPTVTGYANSAVDPKNFYYIYLDADKHIGKSEKVAVAVVNELERRGFNPTVEESNPEYPFGSYKIRVTW